MLSTTILRQNPSNVYQWKNKLKLTEGLVMNTEEAKDNEDEDENDPTLLLKTYFEAIQSIDPSQAFGRFSQIWIDLSRLYEKYEDIKNCNDTLFKASKVQFR